ncbi:hypothetical protein KCP71_22250 [Salmonella enterica subsp. enterica]|nr:hypothetical protein KCP71_22250 [Salmonella enterica subsp. enterica]
MKWYNKSAKRARFTQFTPRYDGRTTAHYFPTSGSDTYRTATNHKL